MEKKSKIITLPCDCRCCMLVVEKTAWEDGSVDYNISVQDSRYDHNNNTLWGRIKGAVKVLFGKPVRYNDICLEGTENFAKFVKDLNDLASSGLTGSAAS